MSTQTQSAVDYSLRHRIPWYAWLLLLSLAPLAILITNGIYQSATYTALNQTTRSWDSDTSVVIAEGAELRLSPIIDSNNTCAKIDATVAIQPLRVTTEEPIWYELDLADFSEHTKKPCQEMLGSSARPTVWVFADA